MTAASQWEAWLPALKKACGSGEEAEVFIRSDRSRSVSWSEGKPAIRESSASGGVSLRLLTQGAQSMIARKSLNANQLAREMDQARSVARYTPKNPHVSFTSPNGALKSGPPCDESSLSLDLNELAENLATAESQAVRTDPRIKKAIKLRFDLESSETVLMNSKGLMGVKSATSYVFMGEILAEENGESEVGWKYKQSRLFNRLDVKSLIQEITEAALNDLGGRAIPTKSYTVVLDPKVGVQILDLLSRALSAEEVQLNRSFMKGRMGLDVASSHVNIIDDPSLPENAASEGFDDEGTPRTLFPIVEEGRLRGYFYDRKSASIEGRESTGHGNRSTWSSMPRPGPCNLFFSPGRFNRTSLLDSAKTVFWVEEVMGLHMADPMTGEFSLGASGLLYENGKKIHPVRGVTIAGRLEELLKKIKSVGSDLEWFGSFGSPSLLVEGVSVAGS